MVRSLVRIQVEDAKAQRALDSVGEAFREISKCPLLDGRQIDGVELANAVTNKIPHKLGRRLRGWILVDTTGATSTGRIQRVLGADLGKELWLQANGHGATITVGLWVY